MPAPSPRPLPHPLAARSSSPLPAAADPVEPIDPLERALGLVLALASVLIVAVVLHGDARWVDPLVSEEGPLERAAALAWLVLAPLVLWSGGTGRRALSLASVCLLFGARELDLHKSVGATSFLKARFYTDGAVALTDKLLGGSIALAVLAVVFYGLAVNVRAFWRRRAWRRTWGRIVVAAVALLVLSKALDRTPAILKDDWHRPLGWTASHLITVHEEWLEAFVPLALAAAALRRGRGRSSREAAPGGAPTLPPRA